MSRAAKDWQPLASSDPVPGDSAEVATLARRYRDTAAEILTQAGNLRRLADASRGGWDSDAGRVFAAHATDVADRISKAHDRYATAAEALNGWVDPLERAQADADAALVLAQSAQATMTANAAGTQPLPSTATPADQAAHDRELSAHNAGAEDLATARRRLLQAEADYHDEAARVAHRLRQVIDHDDLHDSFWDKVGGWIHDHAELLNTILKVLSYIVTALAVIALVLLLFVPGLQFISLALLLEVLNTLVLAGTVVLLAGHAALAATGDGSWVDVGLDIVALATMHLGGTAVEAGEAALKGAPEVAAAVAGERAALRATEESASRARLWSLVDRIPVLRTLTGASSRLAAIDASIAGATEQARAAVLAIPMGVTSLTERFAAGGQLTAGPLAGLRALGEAVPGVAEIESRIAAATRAATRNAVVTYSGTLLDGANHVIEDLAPKVKELLNGWSRYPFIHLPSPALGAS